MQHSTAPYSPYPQPGEVLDGKYRVERMLGEGGMGAVAKATHLLRRAPVALKFMSTAMLSLPGAVERFVNEGVAASQIDSDHVVKIFDVGRLPSGAPYLVMEFLDGRDLGDVITHDGPRIEPRRAVHFCLQMLRALSTAHASGVVHRDMKPSNCFVIEKDGEPDFLKLVDFGISKVRTSEDDRGPNLTRTNSALGTPLYMSPEQARSPRDVDQRSDVYSVGAILYEMLCGRTPYTADSGEYTEILFKIFTTEPEPLRAVHPDVSEGLARVVHRALLRDRDARFSSALEMAEALVPFADARGSDLVSRMRGGRARSVGPGAWNTSMTPPPSAAAVGMNAREGSPAHTYPLGGTDALRAPRVPTDVGLSRSADGTARASTSRAAVVGVVVAIAVALCAAAGVVAIRAHRASDSAASATAPPLTPVADVPSGAGSASTASPPNGREPAAPPSERRANEPTAIVLSPPPSAAPVVHGPAAPEPPPRASAHTATSTAPPGQPPLPTQLGDLKLH